MKQMKRIARLLAALLVINLILLSIPLTTFALESDLITTRSGFEKALNGAKDGDTLLVGDIDFNLVGEGAVNERERLTISKNITIKNGKTDGSAVFSGASFVLNGTMVAGAESQIQFVGITFDEGLNADEITHTDWELSYYSDGQLISGTPLKCQYAISCMGNVNAAFLDCSFKNYMSPEGAGIYAWYLDGDNAHCKLNLSLNGCTFERNSALYAGGAIYLRAKGNISLFAVDCTFTDNRSGFDQLSVGGGAVALYDCNAEFHNCEFTKNVGNHFYGGDRFFDFGYIPEMGGNFILYEDALKGGAVLAEGGDLTMRDCTLSENNASYGGAIALTTMTADIEDCHITGNTAISVLEDEYKNKNLGVGSCNGIGGAFYIDGAKHVTIGNTEISGNHAESAYGAIYSTYVTWDSEFYDQFSLELTFCTLRDNTCDVAISDLQDDMGTWLYDTHAIPYIDTFGCLVLDDIYAQDIPKEENPTEENGYNYFGSAAPEEWYVNGHLLHGPVISTDHVKAKLGERNYYGTFTVGANNHDSTYNFYVDGECRESVTMESGKQPTLPAFGKDGHTLTHWTLDGEEYRQDETLVVGNATGGVDLHAVLVPNVYMVTFDFGYTTTQIAQVYGTSLSLPDPPARDGYTFGGWFTLPDGEGEQMVDDIAYNHVGETTYYAFYKLNEVVTPPSTTPVHFQVISAVIVSIIVSAMVAGAIWFFHVRRKQEEHSPVMLTTVADAAQTDATGTPAQAPKIVKTRYTDEEIDRIVQGTQETHLLTSRELEVFCELLKGKKQGEIAYYLGITVPTVKDNAGRIYAKLGVANKNELFEKIDAGLHKQS